jgi:hypothetical protein
MRNKSVIEQESNKFIRKRNEPVLRTKRHEVESEQVHNAQPLFEPQAPISLILVRRSAKVAATPPMERRPITLPCDSEIIEND